MVLCCHAVVFGRVTEGQGLLQKLNAVGTRSGKPKQRVAIADCGELPSKRQILLKLQVGPTVCMARRTSGSCHMWDLASGIDAWIW